jgi:hypothetical protein
METDSMPGAVILGVPAGNKTVVRYAWETDPDGIWEYFPRSAESGVPLGRRLPSHPALGKVPYEVRDGRRVQVPWNHVDGCRVLGR